MESIKNYEKNEEKKREYFPWLPLKENIIWAEYRISTKQTVVIMCYARPMGTFLNMGFVFSSNHALIGKFKKICQIFIQLEYSFNENPGLMKTPGF